MNRLVATITAIESVDSLNIVKFDFCGTPLKMMSLDLGENIQIGQKVVLNAKPSAIALAKNFSGMVSYSNEIKVTVVSVENGKLLSSVSAAVGESILESIITVESVKRMDIQVGEEITVLIKASELFILEVLDD